MCVGTCVCVCEWCVCMSMCACMCVHVCVYFDIISGGWKKLTTECSGKCVDGGECNSHCDDFTFSVGCAVLMMMSLLLISCPTPHDAVNTGTCLS